MAGPSVRGRDVPRGTSNKRVEIVFKTFGDNTKGKRFGYVVGVNTTGGMHFFDQSRTSAPGEVAFLVSRTPDGRSGAIWYSHEGLRFTKAPAELAGLAPNERVGVDLVLEGKNGETLKALVPDEARRAVVRVVGTSLRGLRRS